MLKRIKNLIGRCAVCGCNEKMENYYKIKVTRPGMPPKTYRFFTCAEHGLFISKKIKKESNKECKIM